jgi:hypothetical protein
MVALDRLVKRRKVLRLKQAKKTSQLLGVLASFRVPRHFGQATALQGAIQLGKVKSPAYPGAEALRAEPLHGQANPSQD